jgi:hypothetical protein
VLEAAEEQWEAAAGKAPASKPGQQKEPFSREELKRYFERNVAQFNHAAEKNQAGQPALAATLLEIAKSIQSCGALLETPAALDLEDLERRLTVLDEKVHAALTNHASEELLLSIRRALDSQLSAHRRKMKAEQLALIEKQYAQKRLLEEFRLPRLSLYYLS